MSITHEQHETLETLYAMGRETGASITVTLEADGSILAHESNPDLDIDLLWRVQEDGYAYLV